MGQAHLCLVHLAFARLAAKLQCDLIGLLDSRSSYRMAAGLQTSRGVDGKAAA
jgi:uncharacterized membrane protein